MTQEDQKIEFPKNDFITKLSSAGLIYKYFGKEIITNVCKSEWDRDLSKDELNHVYGVMYNNLIVEIDAIDNGVNVAKE